MTRRSLELLCEEIRKVLIHQVGLNGGHLGSNLGVVELTVAIHAVFRLGTEISRFDNELVRRVQQAFGVSDPFQSPSSRKDRIVFDVGHQSYVHKLLTGRDLATLRQGGGVGGFPKISEGDDFGTGHASTAISAAVGFAIARDFNGELGRSDRDPTDSKLVRPSQTIIAVIGDGALTGGLAFEGLNNAGGLRLKKFLVILNDNDEVSLPTNYGNVKDGVGALSRALRSGTAAAPFFETLGFDYIGLIDGHDLSQLVQVLSDIRERMESADRPILLHVKTVKGKGFGPAESADDRMHAVSPNTILPFDDINTRWDRICKSISDVSTIEDEALPKTSIASVRLKNYSDVFVAPLAECAANDPKIVAVTAAMPGGTGLTDFRFPDRLIDVGICEAHAVTSCSAMALSGLKPFACIYSTFLQRAYDSVIHDVVLQNAPVRFVLDRAGLVGADGATHHGAFDLAYLRCLPGVAICAASDERDLVRMINFMVEYSSGPIFTRFPRGVAVDLNGLKDQTVELGKGRIVMWKMKARAARIVEPSVALLSFGARLKECVESVEILHRQVDALAVTVADARWLKPIDVAMIQKLADSHDAIITVEEGSLGGFGSAVLEVLNTWTDTQGLVSSVTRTAHRPILRTISIPDRIFEQDSQGSQLTSAGLTANRIAENVRAIIGELGVR